MYICIKLLLCHAKITFIFILKLVNLLFSVCFATGYIHSGEIQIFIEATPAKMGRDVYAEEPNAPEI